MRGGGWNVSVDNELLAQAEKALRGFNHTDADEVADLLSALQKEEAFVYYPCRTHELHQNGSPLMIVESQYNHFGYARLECGHKIFFEGKPEDTGGLLPCVHCAEDCHS